jgi:hypothetical protein
MKTTKTITLIRDKKPRSLWPHSRLRSFSK